VLDVNGAQWTGDASPVPWGVKTLGANVVSFVWSPTNQLDSGDADPITPGNQLVPGNNTQYWYRILARNAGGDSPHLYDWDPNPDNTTPPGVWVTTPNCAPDLIINPSLDADTEFQFYSDALRTIPSSSFNPGQTIYVRVKIKNKGANISTSFKNAFYIDRFATGDPPYNTPPDPPSGPPPANTEQTVSGGLLAGQIDTWDFWVPAPSTGGTKKAYAFADYQNAINEGTNEGNNLMSKTYTVQVNAWFETLGGDVGSGTGDISVSQTLPANRWQSDFLAAASGSIGANVRIKPEPTSSGWRINNYGSHRLVPTGTVYDYLASRLRSKATNTACSLTGLSAGNNYYQCVGDTSFGGAAPGGNNIFFVDGNLTVNSNLTLQVNDTAVFIVQGNITINTSVNRIDGIYVAGGTFSDIGGAGDEFRTLTINGAVYANNLSLARVLGGPSCTTPLPLVCDNTKTPAEIINFAPKYLFALNTLLGSAAISWREIAP